MKFLCDNCKAKYQIGDDKVAGKTVRMKCRRCGHLITISASVTESSVARRLAGDPTAPAVASPAIPAPAPSAEPIPLVPRSPPQRPPGPLENDNDDERTVVMASPPKNPLGARPGVPPAPRPAAGVPAAPRPGGAPLPAPRPSAPGAPPPARPVAPAAAAPAGAEGISRAFQRAVTDPHPPPAAPSPRTASEDWYVGIGGVPLGPIRLNVIREKAGQGVVDGDSLVWREGFDEWQPLKNFPELLDLVQEASSQRQSGVPARRASGAFSPLPPRHAPGMGDAGAQPQGPLAALAAQVRSSSPAPEPGRQTPVPAAASGIAGTPVDRGGGWQGTPEPSAAKAPFDGLRPVPTGAGASLNGSSVALDVMTDPFAASRPSATPSPQNGAAAAALAAAAAPFAPTAAPVPVPVAAPRPSFADIVPPRRGLHPMAYAFIAMAAVFGGVAAYVLLVKPPPPPQIVVVQQAAPPPTGANTGDTAAAAPDGTVEVDVGGPQVANRGPVGGPRGPDPKAGGSPSGTPAAPIDTSGFSPGGVAGPSATGPDPKAGSAGGQLSQGEIQGVVSQNQALVRRKCWQPALDARAKDGPSTAKVSATITIGPSGNVDSVSASGGDKDFPGLSSCVASRIKGWKFPPSGGSTTVSVPFVFAAQ